MSDKRKVLLLCTGEQPETAGQRIDLVRLGAALRARGAEVAELPLGAESAALLDSLESGALPVVFRGDRA